MVNSQIEKIKRKDLESQTFSDSVIDHMIAEIIQKDIVSKLKEKAKGIKKYVDNIEDSR